ncbi:hypothetical protein [Luteolibacter marinus]|uniref:hypothetical protein n=1 Tax=Luteolibacter marinus TaxID=2776705 RepID=UPI00186662DA|nr:hypothetical protein [Luteolibacter marinus]
MNDRIALIADGRLLLTGTDGVPRRHECEFAADIERREQRSAEKNSWLRGEEDAGAGMFNRSSLWGSRGNAGPSSRPRIVAVAGGESPGSMVYALWTGIVGAVLEYDFSESYERRVFHRERFHVSEFDRHPRDGRIACRFGDDGVSNLAVLDPDGRNARPVTEGDSIDAAPSWAHGSDEVLLYHSAGLSRDPKGYIRGLGPYGIHRLDLKSGDLETIAESPAHDLLAPRHDTAGNLYYIRRDYEGPEGVRPSAWQTLKDTVLFPFRMIRALVDFFQIFSQIVSKKPLTTAGGPKANGPEPVRMWIHGRMIDVQKASQTGAPDGALAPADWVLVKRAPDGSEETLAKHVLCYDLSTDGRVAWSDGKNLHLIEADGRKRKLCSEPLIDAVKWLGEA